MRRVLALLLLAGTAAAQDNPEMKRIFDEDQRAREHAPQVDWKVVNQSDAERRVAVRKLLAEGALHSGKDFNRAAFVFQHGDQPDDFLLAHTLAMVAMKKGDKDSAWIAAATLDRYLHHMKQPQIYGTQFRWENDDPVTQEPYNRDLISDALRKELGAHTQAEQEEQRKKIEKERRSGQ